jgi:hypothetical protein
MVLPLKMQCTSTTAHLVSLEEDQHGRSDSLDKAEEEKEEEDKEKMWGKLIMPTKKEKSLMMKALVATSSTCHDVLPNPVLADKLLELIKRKFKDRAVTLSLKDPCANLQMTTNGVAFLNSWMCSGNQHITFDPNNMRPIANLTSSHVLLAGYRDYGEDKTRICFSLAITGVMAMGYSNSDKSSPPPLILDMVPAHTKIEFDKTSGCAQIGESNTDVAELILGHVLAMSKAVWIEGWDCKNVLKKAIRKLGLVTMFLTDAMISEVIDDYRSPRARYDMEEFYPVRLVHNRVTNQTTIIVTCMQISSTISSLTSCNQSQGKMFIPFIHKLACGFLDILGSKNIKEIIPNFTTGDASIFCQAPDKYGAAKITKDLCHHGLLQESGNFLLPSECVFLSSGYGGGNC